MLGKCRGVGRKATSAPPYSRWRKRCYLPLMLIMVDATSGFVLGFETISTKEGFDAAIESLMCLYAEIAEG